MKWVGMLGGCRYEVRQDHCCQERPTSASLRAVQPLHIMTTSQAGREKMASIDVLFQSQGNWFPLS